MQKRTKSILDELDTLYPARDKTHVFESRASNIIASAIRLLEQIETQYSAEQAENLSRKFLNAIRAKDAARFTRSLRKTDESK